MSLEVSEETALRPCSCPDGVLSSCAPVLDADNEIPAHDDIEAPDPCCYGDTYIRRGPECAVEHDAVAAGPIHRAYEGRAQTRDGVAVNAAAQIIEIVGNIFIDTVIIRAVDAGLAAMPNQLDIGATESGSTGNKCLVSNPAPFGPSCLCSARASYSATLDNVRGLDSISITSLSGSIDYDEAAGFSGTFATISAAGKLRVGDLTPRVSARGRVSACSLPALSQSGSVSATLSMSSTASVRGSAASCMTPGGKLGARFSAEVSGFSVTIPTLSGIRVSFTGIGILDRFVSDIVSGVALRTQALTTPLRIALSNILSGQVKRTANNQLDDALESVGCIAIPGMPSCCDLVQLQIPADATLSSQFAGQYEGQNDIQPTSSRPVYSGAATIDGDVAYIFYANDRWCVGTDYLSAGSAAFCAPPNPTSLCPTHTWVTELGGATSSIDAFVCINGRPSQSFAPPSPPPRPIIGRIETIVQNATNQLLERAVLPILKAVVEAGLPEPMPLGAASGFALPSSTFDAGCLFTIGSSGCICSASSDVSAGLDPFVFGLASVSVQGLAVRGLALASGAAIAGTLTIQANLSLPTVTVKGRASAALSVCGEDVSLGGPLTASLSATDVVIEIGGAFESCTTADNQEGLRFALTIDNLANIGALGLSITSSNDDIASAFLNELSAALSSTGNVLFTELANSLLGIVQDLAQPEIDDVLAACVPVPALAPPRCGPLCSLIRETCS